MSILIKNANIINEGVQLIGDVLIEGERISKVSSNINCNAKKTINAKGLYLIPGIIDDQVHFREPGLTHKADIYSESKAAVAGGVTSFMEMPNTLPQTLTQDLLNKKFDLAQKKSLANYSFFMGVSNDNLKEVLETNPKEVAALKIFMGSSTGQMLVDDINVLIEVFKKSNMLIAVHCEDETTIKKNLETARKKYGSNIPITEHQNIRSAEACYKSSSLAVNLAKKFNTRLHVFHISTEKEILLFDNKIPLKDKRITAEVCVHHLFFDDSDYKKKGALIKWNPAIKKKSDKVALIQALIDNKIDVIASDHAPHTKEEKNNLYLNCPSGGPLVQHSLNIMLDLVKKNKISLLKVVEKMCHNPAICFKIKDRGYIREDYFADLVLIDLNNSWKVSKQNLLYKCGWSPLEGLTFNSKVTHTIVNGNLVYNNGVFYEQIKGKKLLFDR